MVNPRQTNTELRIHTSSLVCVYVSHSLVPRPPQTNHSQASPDQSQPDPNRSQASPDLNRSFAAMKVWERLGTRLHTSLFKGYHIVLSKHPWTLRIQGPKIGDGRLHGEAICMHNVCAHEPWDQ